MHGDIFHVRWQDELLHDVPYDQFCCTVAMSNTGICKSLGHQVALFVARLLLHWLLQGLVCCLQECMQVLGWHVDQVCFVAIDPVLL